MTGLVKNLMKTNHLKSISSLQPIQKTNVIGELGEDIRNFLCKLLMKMNINIMRIYIKISMDYTHIKVEKMNK